MGQIYEENAMKNILFALPLAALLLGGCAVSVGDPYYGDEYGYGSYGAGNGKQCPPGQAKKGNCLPGGGFCPPGLKKQGRCGPTSGAGGVIIDPGIRIDPIRVDPVRVDIR